MKTRDIAKKTVPSVCALDADKVYLSQFAAGEHDAPEVSTVLSCIEALQLAHQLHDAVRVASLDAGADHSAHAAADAFVAGKNLVAEMIEHAVAIAGNADSEMLARMRRRGTAQDVFARRYMEQVMANPAFLDGFSAALSGALVVGVDFAIKDTPAEIREATYEDFIGGPGAGCVWEDSEAAGA